MWEYKIKEIKFKMYNELIDELNKEGELNWEIITYEEKSDNRNGIYHNAKILMKRIKTLPA